MKHAEKIAERLWYLGGTPTTKPSPIKVGESMKEFLENDTKAEEEAIEMYKGIIELAQKEGDVTTAFVFKEILEDEEDITISLRRCLKRCKTFDPTPLAVKLPPRGRGFPKRKFRS